MHKGETRNEDSKKPDRKGRKMTSRQIRSGVINAGHCSSLDATKIRRCAKIIINCADQIYAGLAAESALCQGLMMFDSRYA